jgi:hypothetical protein
MDLTLQPVPVNTSTADEDGCLIFADKQLVAVLVRLSREHGRKAGRWYLEHGFGSLDHPAHPIFNDLAEAQTWVVQQLSEVKPSRRTRHS